MTKPTHRRFLNASTARRLIVNLDMPAMTMVFCVKDSPMLDKVNPGDKVRFAADKVRGAISVNEIDPAKQRDRVRPLHQRRGRAACGALLISLALSQSAFAQRSKTRAFRQEIRPGKIAEECRHLVADERLRYRFEASTAVPFNVHFHRGNSVEYPVKVERTSKETSIFTASSAEEFCWMWTNETAEIVVIQGELVRVN